MSGQQIMRIYLLRRWWVIACALVGLVVGAGLAFALPSVHEARSQVLVGVAEDAEIAAGESATYVDDWILTLLQIAGSEDFAGEVAASPEVDLTPAEVRAAVDFALVPNTTVVEITAADADPARARTLANAAAETMSTALADTRFGPDTGFAISVLQEAGPATSTAFPDPVRFIVIGGLAGLTLGLILAPLRHGLDRRVRDLREIPELLGTALIGVRDPAANRALRREIARGAATSTSVLLARLGVLGSRGTRTLTLCGIAGVGGELASDLVETAAADGLMCALVSADPVALQTAHYRELTRVRGIDVVDADGGRGRGIRSGEDLAQAMPRPYAEYDLVVLLGTDLVARPDACVHLELADAAIVVSAVSPDRADLLTTRELMRAHATEAAGVVIVARRGTGARSRRATPSPRGGTGPAGGAAQTVPAPGAALPEVPVPDEVSRRSAAEGGRR